MFDFLKDLDENQLSAVKYNDGPQLVIAGAGAGKTRVLTYKIAYLLKNGVKRKTRRPQRYGGLILLMMFR